MAPAKAKRDRWMDNGQSDLYVALCFAGATKTVNFTDGIFWPDYKASS